MTLLRRILIAALIGGLAGLGVITALLGRRRRNRAAVQAEVLTPVLATAPIERKRGGGRRAALAFAGLLLLFGLTGLIYASRDTPLDSAAPSRDSDRKPMAALSGPVIGTNRRPVATDEMATGSLRMSEPGASTRANTPPPVVVPPSSDIVRVEPNAEGKPAAATHAETDQHRILTQLDPPSGSGDIDRRADDAVSATRHAPGPVTAAPQRDAGPLAILTSPVQPMVSRPEPDGSTATASGLTQGPAAPEPRVENDAAPGHEKPLQAGDPATSASLPHPHTESARTGLGAGPSRAGSDTAFDPIQPAPDLHASGATDSATGDPRPTGPRVNSIATAQGSRSRVTAQAAPGTDLRLSLNGTQVAPAIVGRDGTVQFPVDHGVAPGGSTIGLDRVDPAIGQRVDNPEIPFAAPGKNHIDHLDALAAGLVGPRAVAGSGAEDRRASTDFVGRDETARNPPRPSETGSLDAAGPAGTSDKSADVRASGVETIHIVRGDNLWMISRRIYGQGKRYPLIYAANRAQIRDPDLIYPGQILVVPYTNAAATKTIGQAN